jgi:predicted ATP-grasp superfamily ATP-dependent carboligase
MSFGSKGLINTAAAGQLTQWSRVVLEKLIDSQLVKKFLHFKQARKFISVFTRARHFTLF